MAKLGFKNEKWVQSLLGSKVTIKGGSMGYTLYANNGYSQFGHDAGVTSQKTFTVKAAYLNGDNTTSFVNDGGNVYYRIADILRGG